MNRRIRGKINSGEVGALYDNGRKNKTTAKCKWVYTRNACRKNECVPFGDCKMGSGKLKLFGLKNRKLKDKAYEKQKDNYRSHYRNNRNNTLERCFHKFIKQHGWNWNRNMSGYIFWYNRQSYFFKKR